jgi:hypothetical protein
MDTGFRREQLTRDDGSYTFTQLPTGSYEVHAGSSGFQTAIRKGISIAADQRVIADITLQPGSVSESVTVVEAAPLVNQTSTEQGAVLQQKNVVDLPLNGRNFANLAHLLPGVQTGRVGEQAAGGGPNGWRSNIAFNANGMRATTNSFLLDGVDNNELSLDFTISLLPVIDAIQEFKIQTNNFSAEFGRALGGIISVATRSGSNAVHGGLYEFFRNSTLDARNYFATTGAKPPFRQNQFGGSLGGPIVRNRTFYFVDYQGLRMTQAQNFLVTVPSEAMKRGDFSGLPTIYDPLSPRTSPVPFPANRIPEDRIDSASRILSSYFPSQNRPGSANNFENNPSIERQDDQFDIRIDQHLNDRNNLFVRYSFQETSRLNPSALFTPENPFGGAPAAGQFSGDAGIRAQNVALNFNTVIAPTLINEFRFGFNRFSIENLPLGFGVNPDMFGIPGLNINTAALAMPLISVAGFAGLGTANVLPSISASNNFQYLDTVSITKGRHSIRTGASFLRRQRNQFIVPSASGNFSFNGNFTSENGRAGTGHAFASFLLGFPSATQRSFLPGSQGRRNWEWALFLQDDIRLGRVTINAGLRYEVYTPTIEVADRQANFDLTRGTMLPAASNPYGRGLRKTYWGNFGPRLGIAWDLAGNGRTVLRTSYGISYNEELFGLNTFQTLAIPFFIDQQITPGNFTPVNRLSDGLQVPVLDPNRPSGLIRAINPDFQPGSAQMFSFGLQRQVTGNMVAEVGFVGTLGRHLAGFRDFNQSRPGTGPANPRRPLFPVAPDVGRVFYIDSRTNSHSESLIARLTKRYSQGVAFLASYTFGKTMEGQEGTVPGPFTFPMDAQNLELERAVASFDRTHRFAGSWSWELPFGRNRRWARDTGALANAIAGGWQLSGIASLATGTPFPISLNTPVSGSNGFTERPDRIGGGALPSGERSAARWFDVTAFRIPAVGTFGNAGRNILRSAGQVNFDISAMKAFQLSERFVLQYRAEFFNLFNTPQLGLPNGAIGAPGAGSITSTAGNNRQIQMALKLNF